MKDMKTTLFMVGSYNTRTVSPTVLFDIQLLLSFI